MKDFDSISEYELLELVLSELNFRISHQERELEEAKQIGDNSLVLRVIDSLSRLISQSNEVTSRKLELFPDF